MLELRKPNRAPRKSLSKRGRSDTSANKPRGSDRQASKTATIGGVVLAGTHPWGRCALDRAVPRPLLPVANQPLIHYAVDWMDHPSLKRVTVCGNSDTPVLRAGLASETLSHGSLDFYVDPMPRGPAGCVKDAALQQSCGTLVVADGTIVPQVDLMDLVRSHRRSGAILTVVVVRNTQFGTRRADQLTPMGIYVFSERALEFIPDTGYQDIKETLIPKLHAAKLSVGTYDAGAQAPRVTGADTYMAVNDWAVEQLCSNPSPPEGFHRVGESLIHESASVHSSARLAGSVLVGPWAVVGREVCIVGPTSIGPFCRIEANAVLCRSSVWKRCTVGSDSAVDRCIIADGAHVHAGSSIRGTVALPEAISAVTTESDRKNWPDRRDCQTRLRRPDGTAYSRMAVHA